LSKDLSRDLAALMERIRPVSDHQNITVSSEGHHCNLPVFIGYPVSLDPRTGERASPLLIVRCTVCSTFWGVKRHRPSYGPDLVWVEKRPRMHRTLMSLRALAVDFNADVAYRKPDPMTIDWSLGGPRKLNGMRWRQAEFPEMLGEGAEQCTSHTRQGHGRLDGPTEWTTYQCLLKKHHAGMHEAYSDDSGIFGWTNSLRIKAA
jgi:hypothetical protein